ncbi:hypothetical protein J4G08_03680 [Candidatus Poribacteria bacterium]|nr:hypothetical protein [Candidatus Poribacteria bacterium]
MLKKVLYVILAIAFLIGTHLIAHEQANEWPNARPSVSTTAGANEATAIASLDPIGAAHVEVGNPVTLTGSGYAFAKVWYYFSEDDDGAIPETPDDLGTIAVTLEASWKNEESITISPHEKKETTVEGGGSVSGEVGASIPGTPVKVGGEAELEGSASETQKSDSGVKIEKESGYEKEVTPTHNNEEARVEGNANHFKFCSAIATFDGKPMAYDCDSYEPSFFEFLSVW